MSSSEIQDPDELFRRIHPSHVKANGELTSAAFKDPEMSVDWDEKVADPKQCLAQHKEYGLAVFVAGDARDLEQEVVYDPELFNPAHSLVIGDKPRSKARKLKNKSVLCIKVGELKTCS